MAGSFATSSGLMGGANALQDFLVQRKMEAIAQQQALAKAQQQDFENQQLATKTGAEAYKNLADAQHLMAPPEPKPVNWHLIKTPTGDYVEQASDQQGLDIQGRTRPYVAAPKEPTPPGSPVKIWDAKTKEYLGMASPDTSIAGDYVQGPIGNQDHYHGKNVTTEDPNPKPVDPTVQAMRDQTLQNAQGVAGQRQAEQDARSQARLDRSYNEIRGQIDKTAAPIYDHYQKVSDAASLIMAPSEAGDGLAIPKILTALVGGQGSGLRLTQSEISSVLNTQTKWQQLQTALSKWTGGPALNLAPELRQEMLQLLTLSKDKAAKQLGIVRSAGNSLRDSQDVNQHRKIYDDMQAQLDATLGGSGAAGSATLGPDGQVIIR